MRISSSPPRIAAALTFVMLDLDHSPTLWLSACISRVFSLELSLLRKLEDATAPDEADSDAETFPATLRPFLSARNSASPVLAPVGSARRSGQRKYRIWDYAVELVVDSAVRRGRRRNMPLNVNSEFRTRSTSS